MYTFDLYVSHKFVGTCTCVVSVKKVNDLITYLFFLITSISHEFVRFYDYLLVAFM